jgi:hypothetical protein
MTMTKTTTTTSKTTFTVTLDSIIKNYSTNMLEWLKDLHHEGETDMFAEDLASFSNYLLGLRGGHTVAIRELFDGQTLMLLSTSDFDEIEQAEKNDEAWELLVVDDGSEIVRLNRKQVNW